MRPRHDQAALARAPEIEQNFAGGAIPARRVGREDRDAAGVVAMNPVLLVTGFGPFPHVRVNPTTKLARQVAGSPRFRLAGLGAQALVLETSYRGGLPHLEAAIRARRPAAVLMLGLAARALRVRVERYARRSQSPLVLDAAGRSPGDAGGEARPIQSNANLEAALSSLVRAKIAARISHTAGRYLCNAGYHLALTQGLANGVPTLFVHVPWLRPPPGAVRSSTSRKLRPRPANLAAALASIGIGLLLQARRARLKH